MRAASEERYLPGSLGRGCAGGGIGIVLARIVVGQSQCFIVAIVCRRMKKRADEVSVQFALTGDKYSGRQSADTPWDKVDEWQPSGNIPVSESATKFIRPVWNTTL